MPYQNVDNHAELERPGGEKGEEWVAPYRLLPRSLLPVRSRSAGSMAKTDGG